MNASKICTLVLALATCLSVPSINQVAFAQGSVEPGSAIGPARLWLEMPGYATFRHAFQLSRNEAETEIQSQKDIAVLFALHHADSLILNADQVSATLARELAVVNGEGKPTNAAWFLEQMVRKWERREQDPNWDSHIFDDKNDWDRDLLDKLEPAFVAIEVLAEKAKPEQGDVLSSLLRARRIFLAHGLVTGENPKFDASDKVYVSQISGRAGSGSLGALNRAVGGIWRAGMMDFLRSLRSGNGDFNSKTLAELIAMERGQDALSWIDSFMEKALSLDPEDLKADDGLRRTLLDLTENTRVINWRKRALELSHAANPSATVEAVKESLEKASQNLNVIRGDNYALSELQVNLEFLARNGSAADVLRIANKINELLALLDEEMAKRLRRSLTGRAAANASADTKAFSRLSGGSGGLSGTYGSGVISSADMAGILRDPSYLANILRGIRENVDDLLQICRTAVENGDATVRDTCVESVLIPLLNRVYNTAMAGNNDRSTARSQSEQEAILKRMLGVLVAGISPYPLEDFELFCEEQLDHSFTRSEVVPSLRTRIHSKLRDINTRLAVVGIVLEENLYKYTNFLDHGYIITSALPGAGTFSNSSANEIAPETTYLILPWELVVDAETYMRSAKNVMEKLIGEDRSGLVVKLSDIPYWQDQLKDLAFVSSSVKLLLGPQRDGVARLDSTADLRRESDYLNLWHARLEGLANSLELTETERNEVNQVLAKIETQAMQILQQNQGLNVSADDYSLSKVTDIEGTPARYIAEFCQQQTSGSVSSSYQIKFRHPAVENHCARKYVAGEEVPEACSEQLRYDPIPALDPRRQVINSVVAD